MRLVLKEDLPCFAALALDLLQEDTQRQEELKVLNDPKFLLWMILDDGKSRVLFNPKISSLKLDNEKSSLKWCEWQLNDGQENTFLAFEECGGLEEGVISNVFLLLISLEEKSKVLLGPKIFFELGHELEGKHLEEFLKEGKDLVGRINSDSRSSSKMLRNLEGEECEDSDRFSNVVLVDSNLDEKRCMKLASWKEYFEVTLCSSFLIEETCLMDETLGSLWK